MPGAMPGATIYRKFTTRDGGVPFLLGGSPVVKVYKNADTTTESTAGVTLTANFDSVVGLNHVSIDTSADGTFYSAGGHFELVITAGTVNGNSVVGEVVGMFDLENTTVASYGVNVVNWLGVVPLALSSQQVQAVVPASQHVIVDSGTVTTVTNQLTVATITDAVWDEARASHTTVGSFGEYVMARLADGVEHGGTDARLVLRSAAVVATGGDDALTLSADSGGNVIAASASGAGDFLTVYSEGSACLNIVSGSGHVVRLAASGDGSAIVALGAGTGPAVQLGDGSSGAEGLKVLGRGLRPAVQLGDGVSGGHGLACRGGPAGGAGMEGASNATPVVITSSGHGLSSGDRVVVVGVEGNTAANGTFFVTVLDADTFALDGSVGSGDYTSGGTWSLPQHGVFAAGGDTAYGLSATLAPATLASFFTTDSLTTFASAVDGSVVKEIATNAGGGGGSPWDELRADHVGAGSFGEHVLSDRVMLSGTLGDQGLGDVNHIVLPSGPVANGTLLGARLRITSGAGQYHERTIRSWDGTNRIAGIDSTMAVLALAGDGFQVLYDNAAQMDSAAGNVIAVADVYNFEAAALAQLFTLDSTKVFADAVAGSVVGEIAANVSLAPDASAEVAEALLKYDWTLVTGEASFSMLNALRRLRNPWAIVGSSYIQYKENGTSQAWTHSVATNAGAIPVTSES